MFDTDMPFTLDSEAVRAVIDTGDASPPPPGGGHNDANAVLELFTAAGADSHPGDLEIRLEAVDGANSCGFVLTVARGGSPIGLTGGYFPIDDINPQPGEDTTERGVSLCWGLVDKANAILRAHNRERYERRGAQRTATGPIDDNETRADLGGIAVRTVAKITRVDSEEAAEVAVSDTLAYIAHFCDRLGLDPETHFATGFGSYQGDYEDGPKARPTLDAEIPLAELAA